MELDTEYISLSPSDGTAMRAYVVRPPAPRAVMLVFQEAFGVNAHIRDVAERFAHHGFLSIAPELYHRTGPGFEGSYDDFAGVAPHFRALTDAGLEADIRAVYDWAPKELPIAAIGFCMGGRVATQAAIVAPLVCGISYYGGGIAPSPYFPGLLDRLAALQAPMLFFWGGLDRNIGPEQTQAVTSELRAAKKQFVSVEVSYADHGFFCDARAQYHASAAAQAWSLTHAFLDSWLVKAEAGAAN